MIYYWMTRQENTISCIHWTRTKGYGRFRINLSLAGHRKQETDSLKLFLAWKKQKWFRPWLHEARKQRGSIIEFSDLLANTTTSFLSRGLSKLKKKYHQVLLNTLAGHQSIALPFTSYFSIGIHPIWMETLFFLRFLIELRTKPLANFEN